MKYFGYGVGTAVGTLLYTRYLSDAAQFDWHRALFVGLFVGLTMAGLSLLVRKKTRD